MSKNKQKNNKKNIEKNIDKNIEKNIDKDIEKSIDKDIEKSNDTNSDSEEQSVVENVLSEDKVVSASQNEEAKPQTTKAQRFFNVIDKFGDMFLLNILFFVTSIPIITIGASFTALYTVTNKMVRDEEGPVKEEYFKAFKSNFKQSTAIWIIDLLYIGFVMLQYMYYLANDNQVSKFLFVFIGFEFVFFAFAFPLQFPLAARYENTTFNIMKNAVILAFANFFVWLRMFFIWTFPFMLYYLRPNLFIYTWYLWILIIVSLLAYACSMFLSKFYKKLEE